MAFRKYSTTRRYNAGMQSNRRVYKPNGALTRKFAGKINRTVQRIQPRQRKVDKNGGGNPGIHNRTAQWTRTVRIAVNAQSTSLTSTDIFNADALYYGITATTPPAGTGPSRWRQLKVLGFKAYGLQSVTALTITALNESSTSSGTSTFTDFSNLNDRCVISVEMPATQGISERDATTGEQIITFGAGTLELVDFYVQFS